MIKVSWESGAVEKVKDAATKMALKLARKEAEKRIRAVAARTLISEECERVSVVFRKVEGREAMVIEGPDELVEKLKPAIAREFGG